MATFSYAHAAKLLGGPESKIVTALDKLLSGALLGGSVLGMPELLSWFDAKSDFIRLSHELVAKVSDRKHSRYTRTQRLHAAHTVIVMTAFIEAFREHDILRREREFESRAGLSRALLDEPPLPSPARPYESHLESLENWYLRVTRPLVDAGILLSSNVAAELVRRAMFGYEGLFRRLAGDFPEVAFWWAVGDAQATRAEIRTVGTALARLQQILAPIGDSPAERRAELAAKYSSALDHPIVEPDQASWGPAIPSLRQCYVDPLFQVCESGPATRFAQKSWWEEAPVRDDLATFLAGYLTSPVAITLPMLVLGDPGSGKSVLTKVLAAQLPASDFMVLRVELRSAPAEADILEQIEYSLRDALQEQTSWPVLVRSAGPALPVVLLDGFDELLQATGVSQSDYLTRIARFQRDSADVGRPVAVVVTSRISVADRAVAPDGTVVLRLVPFNEHHIEQWLGVWNRTNAQQFAAAGYKPLDPHTVLRYPQLSEQPLLLLMLALYDADGNALQNDSGLLSESELYERLLSLFARREVTKDGGHRSEREVAAAVEQELDRLSIVALAMFNRGAQWVSEHDLDKDLAALVGTTAVTAGARTPLSAGEAVLGRFFFVQRAQAIRDDRTLRTYEFLHATFGEFLVARSAWRVLLDLVAVERNHPRRKFSSVIDDSELYALVSFVPLCERGSIIKFLQQMALGLRETERADILALLIDLFRAADQPHPNRTLGEYAPETLSVPARYAAYSVNLVLVAVVVSKRLRATQLFGDQVDAAKAWTSCARLWQSQLQYSSWQALVGMLYADRVQRDGRRDLELFFGVSSERFPVVDLRWNLDLQEPVEVVQLSEPLAEHARGAYFVGGFFSDVMVNALQPVTEVFPDFDGTLVRTSSGQVTSRLHALLALFLQDFSSAGAAEHISALGLSDELVLTALRANPTLHDPSRLDGLDWMLGKPDFWVFLCERIGKGEDDVRLTELLCRIWRPHIAFRKIPEHVLDAWLRVAERGSAMSPRAPSLRAVLDGINQETLVERRPDLLRRARNLQF